MIRRVALAVVHEGARGAAAVVGFDHPIVFVLHAARLDVELAAVERALAAGPAGERLELRIAGPVLAACLDGRARPQRHAERLARITGVLGMRAIVGEVAADDPDVLRAAQLAADALQASAAREDGAR